MRKAGVGEARQNLSVLLQFVAQGHEILITDRGRPVARLVAPLPLSPEPFEDRVALRRAMPVFDPPVTTDLVEEPLPHNAKRPPWPVKLTGPLYLDGTALAKLYLPEPESTELGQKLDGRRDLTVADLAVTEVVTAFSRRLSEVAARSRSELAGELHSALLDDLNGGHLRRIEISPSAYRAAERVSLSLSQTQKLRPRQSLHLALAMTAGVSALITFDANLKSAAQALGLRVLH
jgi:antitoxin (DNA-binding transcriptional repressor) of toxin-antitoxin stability system/predicted nucleic acid-binding protein